MLYLKDIRDWLPILGVAEDENVYIGKLDNKKQKSIGVYHRDSSGQPVTAIGGSALSSYGIKPVSLLVHWNKSECETEKAAYALFEKLRNITNIEIAGTHINFIRLIYPNRRTSARTTTAYMNM